MKKNMEENQNIAELQPGIGLCGGKYVIEKKIGEGGFGITYRAVQTGLNRAVCIKEYFLAGRCVRDVQAKTIHLQGAEEDLFEKYRLAFVKEAQTLAQLSHPGIVKVIDIFDENNTSYMVMPFIEGRSLQSIVEKNGPLSYPEAVNYMAQIANAVGYIHDRHILHRDIKPDNIMITSDFKAVLIDFGSAREFEEDKMQSQTSMVTHGYAPTEQYTRSSRKGAYTDIYAIGATLYFVLTGKVPLEAAARITETMPEPKEINPELPEEANRTIMKAMQLKSEDRHQSISEFMDDLQNVKPTEPVVSQVNNQDTTSSDDVAVKPLTPPIQQKERKPHGWIPFAAIGGAVFVGLVIFFAFFNKSPQYKEAKKNVYAYEKCVANCNKGMEMGGFEDPDPLIFARKDFEKVRKFDSLYHEVMPEVYFKSDELGEKLFPMLKTVANQWAEDARKNASKPGGLAKACQSYEISLSVLKSSQVEAEYKSVKDRMKHKKTISVNNNSGVVDDSFDDYDEIMDRLKEIKEKYGNDN